MEQTKLQKQTLGSDASIQWKDTNLYDLMYGTYGNQEGFPDEPGGPINSHNMPLDAIGLFSSENDKIYVPEKIKIAFDAANGDQDRFAQILSGYTPSLQDPDEDIDPEPSVDPEPEIEPNYEITRKTNPTVTIPANQSNQILKINDTLIGTRYYTISTGSKAVTFEILDNRRILFNGNSTKIDAYDGQVDDFIVFGSYNTINTGDKDDTIRVGYVGDSGGRLASVVSSHNTINAGSGDDYIQSYGYSNKINGDEGYDTVYKRSGSITKNSIEFDTTTTASDNKLELGMQKGYGSCQTLSFINCINENGRFNEYFDIQQLSSTKWNVTFKKSGKTIEVNESDITDKSSVGDKDFVLLETAVRLWLKTKGQNWAEGSTKSTYKTYTIAQLLVGSSKGKGFGPAKREDKLIEEFINRMKIGINAYMQGKLSNLCVLTQYYQENETLGIIPNHVYAVKDAVVDEYVTLINPWDNRDSITLDWEDFTQYFYCVVAYDDTYTFFKNDSNFTSQDGANGGASGDGGLYDYYYQLYQVINEAGGCITVPDEMMHSSKYLINMINGGYAYLKEYNNNHQKWEDTSVATNTKLQEVEDESDLRKAEAKYEAEMRRIDHKDRKYDYDLAALDNERNAIKQEMETLKTVIKDNVERTFRLFS